MIYLCFCILPFPETKFIKFILLMNFLVALGTCFLPPLHNWKGIPLIVIHLLVTVFAIFKVKTQNDYTGKAIKLFSIIYPIINLLECLIIFFYLDDSTIRIIFLLFVVLISPIYFFHYYWLLISTRIIEKDDHLFSNEETGRYLEETF